MAEELSVEPVSTSLKSEWDSGALEHGQNSHSGKIGDSIYPNLWSYWVVADGDTPKTFDLEPLKANRKSPSAQTTNVLTPDEKKSSPGLVNNYFLGNSRFPSAGAGYSFENPFDHKIKVIIEGRINYRDADNKVYVYTKSPDGTVNILTSTDDDGALVDTPESKIQGDVLASKESKNMRKYLKLQCETELAPGDRIYVIGYGGNSGNRVTNANGDFCLFYLNDNWGTVYQPVFIVEK